MTTNTNTPAILHLSPIRARLNNDNKLEFLNLRQQENPVISKSRLFLSPSPPWLRSTQTPVFS